MSLSVHDLEREKLLAWEMLEVYATHMAYACEDAGTEERTFWVRVLKEKDRIQEEARALIAKHEEDAIYKED